MPWRWSGWRTTLSFRHTFYFLQIVENCWNWVDTQFLHMESSNPTKISFTPVIFAIIYYQDLICIHWRWYVPMKGILLVVRADQMDHLNAPRFVSRMDLLISNRHYLRNIQPWVPDPLYKCTHQCFIPRFWGSGRLCDCNSIALSIEIPEEITCGSRIATNGADERRRCMKALRNFGPMAYLISYPSHEGKVLRLSSKYRRKLSSNLSILRLVGTKWKFSRANAPVSLPTLAIPTDLKSRIYRRLVSTVLWWPFGTKASWLQCLKRHWLNYCDRF